MLFVTLSPDSLITFNIETMDKYKVVKIVLEIVKLVATALLGYFGGNAVI